ncbi:hypothetical protein [Bifidobacterium aemilianum]|nr:hypothetical protein [Bifidobacterium aemilianum]
MRMYAFGALACLMWLIQSTREALADGSLWSPANGIFTLCLLVAIGYTGTQAYLIWRQPEVDHVPEAPDKEPEHGPKSDIVGSEMADMADDAVAASASDSRDGTAGD